MVCHGGVTSELHIYTQNVYGLPFTDRRRRFDALARQIRELSPDVVFLQEVLFKGDDAHFQVEGYHRAFVPSGPWNRGGLLTLSRTPIRRVRFQPFRAQGAWHNRQLSDRLLGKGWLEAEVPAWGLTLVNTHLVSTYREEHAFVHDHGQRAQLDELLQAVRAMGPSILAGDFNFAEGTPFHARAQAHVEDVARGLSRTRLRDLMPRLDHIFVRQLGWQEARARLVLPGSLTANGRSRAWSDHAGVSVHLDLGWLDAAVQPVNA